MSIYNFWNKVSTRIFTLMLKRDFKSFGIGSFIQKPLKIDGSKNISIEDNVFIAKNVWLGALPLTGGTCQITIGKGSRIGHFNHIYATSSIAIGESVLTADRVYISDNLHSYENVSLPILNQPIKQCNPVIIGEGTWIGENVCIIGSNIGKNCVIGANAVVTKDIPDYCVVVGAPARIIKRYCKDTLAWRKTKANGEILN